MESRPTLTGRVAAAAVRGSPTWQLVTIPVRFAGAGSEGLDRPPHRAADQNPHPGEPQKPLPHSASTGLCELNAVLY
jgi:hypothetical protein